MDALQRSDMADDHPGRIGPASPRRGGLLRTAYVPAPATPAAPVPPPGVVAQPIDFDARLEAPRTEWFLAGTETAHVTLASAQGSAARLITSPEDQSIVALDPDIPPAVQRLRFEAVNPALPGAAWRLDGKRLGAARPLPWSPWPGHHVLELVDAKGVALDTVSFDVRGAQANAAGPAKAAGGKGSRPSRKPPA
jgi:penicillin-binding protein 1C